MTALAWECLGIWKQCINFQQVRMDRNVIQFFGNCLPGQKISCFYGTWKLFTVVKNLASSYFNPFHILTLNTIEFLLMLSSPGRANSALSVQDISKLLWNPKPSPLVCLVHIVNRSCCSLTFCLFRGLPRCTFLEVFLSQFCTHLSFLLFMMHTHSISYYFKAQIIYGKLN